MATITFAGAVGDGVTDDTAAIQAAINANPSNTTFDGQGKTYKISAALIVPAGSRRLTIKDTNFTIVGDAGFLDVAPSMFAYFLRLDNVDITATGHTTVGRRLITYTNMSFFRFYDVTTNGTPGKTVHYYGNGNGAGTGPYYGIWQGCYMGNMLGGIWAEDAAPSQSANSNLITGCRIQPGAGTGLGNFGLYLGKNSQQFTVIGNEFESPGGNIYVDGQSSVIMSNRFEGVGTIVNGDAIGNTLMSNYRSSSTLAWYGSASANNYHPYGA